MKCFIGILLKANNKSVKIDTTKKQKKQQHTIVEKLNQHSSTFSSD